MTAALEVSRLSFGYGSQPVLEDISFTVGRNESVGIVGANGSGKSTLLWCIAGLLRAKGTVRLFGEPSSRSSRARLAMVFQNPEDQLFMPALVQDLALPLLNRGVEREKAFREAGARLADFGLEDYRDRPAAHLSLGQRKRAALALALMRDPELLLLDEPTAELDGRAVRLLAGALERIPAAKLIATHDLGFLRRTTTRTLLLRAGRIAADGPTEELLANEPLLEQAGLI
ncbi:MAG TPA: ABC transporter ATP-binding protein [Bryobacteraceae bacterium]|nr:ABC transporter ATP-binding protein [Bryobacteraceae bacterium]HPU73247.1 ABC transporter ATP-binding protein [Bryobacteraceae bacterium]